MRLLRLVALAATVTGVLAAGASALDINQDVVMPDAEVGTYYEFEFEGEEGCLLSYHTRFSSGRLPAGMEVTDDLRLIGTPQEAGYFEFYVELYDEGCGGGPPSDASQGYFLLEVLPDLGIATETLPFALGGRPYQHQLESFGEDAVGVRWSIKEGALPAGLTLSEDGVISGTPTEPGRASFVARVEEPFRRWGERTLELAVAGALTASAPAARIGEVSVQQSTQLQATGGLGPRTWAVAGGTLPPGLTLDPATGVVSGTPTQAGRYPVQFTVTGAAGQTASAETAFTIAARLTIVQRVLPPARVGTRYVSQIRTAGGVGTQRWKITSGRLPRGVRLNTRTGRLVGMPRQRGRFAFVAEATDRFGVTAGKRLRLVVR